VVRGPKNNQAIREEWEPEGIVDRDLSTNGNAFEAASILIAKGILRVLVGYQNKYPPRQ